MENYINIGKVVASHGIKGECIVKHSLSENAPLKDLKLVFIEKKKDTMIPYFIESLSIKKDAELLVKFEGIDTPEQAKLIAKKNLWLTEKEFLPFRNTSSPITFLGYMLISFNDKKLLGEILEIIEQPHQILCRLEIEGNEVYIPLHENSLKKIDKKSKKIYVEVPEGLLDVYL